MASPWAVDFGADQDCPSRMVCFAHAGGGPSTYAGWWRIAPGALAVSAALLPGRESRMREPCQVRMEQLIGPLYEGLASRLTRPFLLFGHSFGAIVAFEIARRATADGLPLLGLVVSGRRAPHLAARRPELHSLEPDALIEALSYLQGTPSDILRDPSLMRHFLPCLRADLEINETYRPLPGGTLDCPIIAVMGRDDTEVNESELLAWREVTLGAYYSNIFEGGHFYLKSHSEILFDFFRNKVLPDLGFARIRQLEV